MAATFFPQGIAHLNAAVAQDKAQNYKEALKLYVRSLEFFIAGLKCIFPNHPHKPVFNLISHLFMRV